MTEILYPNGYSGALSSLDDIRWRVDWQQLDREFARRLAALMVASGGALGFGGGWRSTSTQRALFVSRYHVDPHGSITFEGKRWTKNAGVASAAPPGRSYHESTTGDDRALAADMIGDLSWLRDRGSDFGLVEFSGVNAEPWHAQPIEIPHARSGYVCSLMDPLEVWVLPGDNQLVIDEDDMTKLIQVPGDAAIFLVDGFHAVWMGPGVDSALRVAGIAPAGDPVSVGRAGLKGLILEGPLPDYGGPGPTTADSFAAVRP